MAPIKFEDNIREKLQEREIQPSQDAWNLLQTQLDEKQEKGSNKMFWFAIAASVVTILIVGSLVFNASETVSTTKIVLEDAPSVEVESKKDLNTEKPLQEAVALEETIPDVMISEKPSEIIITKPQKKQQTQHTEALAVLQKNTIKKQTIETPIVHDAEKLFVDNKVDEVVAQVKSLQKINDSITPVEIDALLAKAQLEIQTKRILSNKKVDATALLEDVELELELSFRDKVYAALGDGFQFIKTAVVERNN